MLKYILLFILVGMSQLLGAQIVFENNQECIKIYNQIVALKSSAAYYSLIQQVKAQPNNGIHYMLANYLDFYELFFSENKIDFESRKKNEAIRLNILNKADQNSPYFLHSQAIVYFQWALLKLRFKEYLGATKDLRKANQLFKQNKIKFPAWELGNAYIGSVQCAIAAVPSSYKWAANLLGFNGNLQEGKQLVYKSTQNPNNVFKMDALFFYVYIKQYLDNSPTEAWQIIKKYSAEAKQNRLLTFMIANIAINQNKADETIKAITENQGQKGFMHLPILDYELGCAYLFKLEPKCIPLFNNYTQQFKGHFYIKDAYYKMAMMHHINGENVKAQACMSKILKAPASDADADKQAQNFALQPVWPNIELLKMRFLCDGGSFNIALNIAKKFIAPPNHQLEFKYRKARIFDELKQNDSAIVYYKQTIDLGKDESSYFASKACLQLAYIYENSNQKKMAIQYYKQSMQMKNTEYRNSIEMRAKAGLQRL